MAPQNPETSREADADGAPQRADDASTDAPVHAPRPAQNPRLTHSAKDMLMVLVPLLVAMVAIAGVASQCSFHPGGPTAGPAPTFDVDAGLQYDARELGFPIRNPELPEGWHPNSGSRSIIAGEHDGDSSTVGYLTPAGRYVRYTQSNAGEIELVRFVAGGARSVTGAESIGAHDWTVYGGEGVEPLWVSDFGDVRILLGGSGTTEEFRVAAEAIDNAVPLTP